MRYHKKYKRIREGTSQKQYQNYQAGDPLTPWREKLYKIIFKADTFAGKLFDIILIAIIFLSVLAVMLDSVESFSSKHRSLLFALEWFFTIIFTIEYILRLICVRKPWLYAKSFYGIVDFLSIIPTYLALFIGDAQYFLVIRSLRVLRVFRIFKLASYMGEANMMADALKNSRHKISVFLYTVLLVVIIFGSVIYVVEGPENGFKNIPHSVYWAIVTLTTVGYGDISPQTPLGQFIASAIMILGYGIIAVPTGIYSAELTRVATSMNHQGVNDKCCPSCSYDVHDSDAVYCKKCGTKL